MELDWLARKLFERGAAEVACPICGKEDWTAPDTPLFLMSAEDPGSGNGDPQLPVQGYKAALLVCGNCGFMRMHDLATLEDEPD